MKRLIICMLLIFLFTGYGWTENNVAVNIISKRGFTKTIYVNRDTEELQLIKTDVGKFHYRGAVDIKGIEKLKNLKTVRFYVVPMFADFDFLTKVPWIENIYLYLSSALSIDFIHRLPNLKRLIVMENFEPLPTELDLSYNPHLEYLEFSYCGYKTIPQLYNIPDTLRCLNLCGNRIETFDIDTIPENMLSIPVIYLDMNPVAEKDISFPDNFYPGPEVPAVIEEQRNQM